MGRVCQQVWPNICPDTPAPRHTDQHEYQRFAQAPVLLHILSSATAKQTIPRCPRRCKRRETTTRMVTIDILRQTNPATQTAIMGSCREPAILDTKRRPERPTPRESTECLARFGADRRTNMSSNEWAMRCPCRRAPAERHLRKASNIAFPPDRALAPLQSPGGWPEDCRPSPLAGGTWRNAVRPWRWSARFAHCAVSFLSSGPMMVQMPGHRLVPRGQPIGLSVSLGIQAEHTATKG